MESFIIFKNLSKHNRVRQSKAMSGGGCAKWLFQAICDSNIYNRPYFQISLSNYYFQIIKSSITVALIYSTSSSSICQTLGQGLKDQIIKWIQSNKVFTEQNISICLFFWRWQASFYLTLAVFKPLPRACAKNLKQSKGASWQICHLIEMINTGQRSQA